MSFNDLERGTTNPPQTSHSAAVGGSRDGSLRGSPRPGRPKSSTPLPLYHAPGGSSSISPQDDDDEGSSSALTPAQTAEIKKLSDSIGAQIFKINSNTAAVQKLLKLADANRTVPSKPATAQGDRDWTKKAHDLVESTRAVVKSTTPTLKQLSNVVVSTQNCPPQHKLALSKLQRDFEQSLQGFSEIQRQSARKSKEELDGAKRAVHEHAATSSSAAPGQQLVDIETEENAARKSTGNDDDQDAQLLSQAQQTKPAGPSLADLEFQEALIAEREAEIREIESGVHELNEIFRDLGQIVQEQGGMIDNIEYNIGEIATNTGEADRELVRANEYQRKAGKRAACLLLIVGFVISAVLLAILS